MDQGHVDKLIVAWGYLGIFICVFVGNLGVPVPEESVVLAAGFLAGQGILDIKFVYLVVVLSAIAGDSSGYLIGRTGGQRLLERLSRRFRFIRRRNERFKTFFNAHGTKAVFMARFITGLRFMAGPMAGAAGMRFAQFLRWNVMGALAWCSIMVAGGYLVGNELYRIIPFAHVTGRWVALGIFLVMVGIVIFWWRERGSTAPGPES
ncbi:MAG: DedA family protein [Candidatus Binataceae bacterium]